MEAKIEEYFQESIRVKQEALKTCLPAIKQTAELMVKTLQNQNKILIFGNGGSAADAQHIVGELVGRFLKERKALPAIALSTNTSVVTSIANDYSFAKVFARQIEALGKPGDLALGISTSGNSANVIEGIKKAEELGLKTVGLTGGAGGELKDIVDIAIWVPADKISHIQEVHITISHLLCQLVEESFS